jgi:hypothetical protein
LLENGGNGDGIIDYRDQIYLRLRLMRADMSLHTLAEYGIDFISLDYRPAHKTDRYGNRGEFKSQVGTEGTQRPETVAYDWWLSYTPDLKGLSDTACVSRKPHSSSPNPFARGAGM